MSWKLIMVSWIWATISIIESLIVRMFLLILEHMLTKLKTFGELRKGLSVENERNKKNSIYTWKKLNDDLIIVMMIFTNYYFLISKNTLSNILLNYNYIKIPLIETDFIGVCLFAADQITFFGLLLASQTYDFPFQPYARCFENLLSDFFA